MKRYLIMVVLSMILISTGKGFAQTTAQPVVTNPVVTPPPCETKSYFVDSCPHDHGFQFEFYGSVDYALITLGTGGGVGFGIPVAPNGFIGTLNDSVYVYINIFSAYYPFWVVDLVSLAVSASMRWYFHLSEDWSVFGDIAMGYEYYYWSDETWDATISAHNFYYALTVGALYHFNDLLALHLSTGYPKGLSVGLTFEF